VDRVCLSRPFVDCAPGKRDVALLFPGVVLGGWDADGSGLLPEGLTGRWSELSTASQRLGTMKI
jgi:hypothetical protein